MERGEKVGSVWGGRRVRRCEQRGSDVAAECQFCESWQALVAFSACTVEHGAGVLGRLACIPCWLPCTLESVYSNAYLAV